MREGRFGGFSRRADRNLVLHRRCRRHRAVGQRLLVARLSRAFVTRSLDLDQHAADRDLVADFAGQLDDLARDRRFHFDGGLVGHHVGELLVFLDPVAELDVPRDDLGLGDAFADVGQLEFKAGHQRSITFFKAFFSRSGPGK